MATLNACEAIVSRLLPVRAALEAAHAADGKPPPTFQEVCFSAYFQRVDLSAHGFYIVPADRWGLSRLDYILFFSFPLVDRRP